MEDAWIGKVMAAGLIGLILWGITALLQARSGAARRARLVIGGALTLLVAWVVFMMVGPIGFIIALAVIGAIVWIAKGSTK